MSVIDGHVQRLPDDVWLSIANNLIATSSPAALPQIMAVHPICLDVALSHLYRVVTLNLSARSVRMIRRIRSEPLLASRVQTLSFNFRDAYHGRSPIVDELVFTQALLLSMASLINVRRLELLWDGWDARPGRRPPKATVALGTFGLVFIELWKHISPTLLELRVEIYVDAIETLSALDGSLAQELVAFDLRVYGGVYPTHITFGAIDRHLAQLARSVLLPTADRLNSIKLCFVPCEGQTSLDEDDYSLIEGPPQLHVDGFFRVLGSRQFPGLRALSIEVPFLALEGLYIADFIKSHAVRGGGGLESLYIAHTSPEGYGDTRKGIAALRKLLRERGPMWTGLRALSVWVPRTTMQSPRDNSFMLPLLGANPALQELTFVGEHLPDTEALRAALQALHPGSRLKRLTARIQLVRPSLFDALANLAPKLEYLRLEYRVLESDGPTPSSILEEVLKEASSWEQPRIEFLAAQRAFLAELAGRRYENWPLHQVSIVHEYASASGCSALPPPHPHAMHLAIALQQCVTGLTLGEVYPLPRRFPPPPALVRSQ